MKKLFIPFLLLLASCNLERIEETAGGVQASFTFTNDNCTAPCTVNFTNTSFGAASYQWFFGDNTPMVATESPMHTYNTGGTFEVILVATGANNARDTARATVTIMAQPIEFSTTLGVGGVWEEGKEVLQTSDGGYLIVAEDRDCTNNKCLQIYKLDRNGQSQWQKTYAFQTFSECRPADLIEVSGSQSGYVIAGHTESGTGEIDAYAMRIDLNGNVAWEQKFGTAGKDERFRAVIQSADGGFVFTGGYEITNNEDYVYILKTNATGDKSWEEKTNYRGPGEAICQMPGGNFMVLSSHPYERIRLLQFASSGSFVSTVQIGDANSNVSNHMIPTSDNGYLITGERGFDQYTDVYVVKINGSLGKVWEKTFADNGWFEAGYKLAETANGDYAVLANRDLNVPILIRLDKDGNQKFYKEYAAGDGYGLDACSDDGFIITGHDGSQGILVLKTDKNGEL